MNKELIRLIILTIGLNLLTLSLLSTERFDTNNAAVYYTKAVDQLKYPPYQERKEITHKIKNILKKGWKSKNSELRNILVQNRDSIQLFKRGFLLEKCDFNFGKKIKYIIHRKPLPLTKLWYLTKLCLLEGKYYESINQDDQAVNQYLSVCRASWQISMDKLTMSKLIAMVIANESYLSLTGYLTSHKGIKRKSKKILTFLEEYKKNHFLPEEMIEHEKEGFINAMEFVNRRTETTI